jgi:anti-anti-sigma factor
VGGAKPSDLLHILPTGRPRSVRLAGELDASNADLLLEALQRELAAGGDLELDVSALEFVDSMGIRSFLRIALALEGTGRLVLRGPPRSVARTMELVGLEKVPNIAIVAVAEA